MAKGFLDMSSLTSALCAVHQGSGTSLSFWHNQSLLEVTYLLLHENIRIFPRPGRFGGEVGDVSIFLSILPSVRARARNQHTAMLATKTWLGNNQDSLTKAWLSAEANPLVWDWGIPQRDLRWVEHSATYGALFDEGFIPHIAKTLQVDESVLQGIHHTTTDPTKVKRWLKKRSLSEDAKIAEKAWMLAGIIRGKYYENMAKDTNLQMVLHPYRKGLEEPLEVSHTQQVNRTEELFVKYLIASALIETTAKRRVTVWSENIDRAKKALNKKSIVLHETITESDAEDVAYTAAKRIGIVGGARIYRNLVERMASWQLPTLIAISLSPWAPVEATGAAALASLLSGAAQFIYKEKRGTSPGDDFAKFAFTTRTRFRWLAKTVPGRIERKIVSKMK